MFEAQLIHIKNVPFNTHTVKVPSKISFVGTPHSLRNILAGSAHSGHLSHHTPPTINMIINIRANIIDDKPARFLTNGKPCFIYCFGCIDLHCSGFTNKRHSFPQKKKLYHLSFPTMLRQPLRQIRFHSKLALAGYNSKEVTVTINGRTCTFNNVF